MRACPNLFDLIYQHAAFPLTWELAAVAPRSDKHLSLSVCYIWSQNKPLSLIIRDFKRGFKARQRGCIHTEGPTRGQTPGCNQSPIQSFLIPFPLSPLYFLPESPHISLLLVFSRPDQIIFLFHGESSCYLYRTDISSAFKKPSPAFLLSFYPSSYYAIWK